MKPNDDFGGYGVTLGWEADDAAWDATIARALGGQDDAWVVQEKIQVRRELFPRFGPGSGAVIGDMLVDCAPYLFRGKLAGFLTRLSAGGLANVTSGGGQVPSFVVREKRLRGSYVRQPQRHRATKTHSTECWQRRAEAQRTGASVSCQFHPPCVFVSSVSLWLTYVDRDAV